MKNYLFPFLTSVILVLSGILNAQGNQEENKNNLFVIDDQTTISFLIPEDKYLYSKSVNENTNLLDLNNINFLQYRDDFDFESYQFYIKNGFNTTEEEYSDDDLKEDDFYKTYDKNGPTYTYNFKVYILHIIIEVFLSERSQTLYYLRIAIDILKKKCANRVPLILIS